MNFSLLPAIDLRDNQVVRLYQGNFARQTTYDIRPAALAERYAAEGANWIHVVDLDGARQGQSVNLATIRELTQGRLRVQAGGGVRCRDDAMQLIDAGVDRVVLGSVAVRDPDLVCRWLEELGGDRLVLALDTRWRDGVWRLYGNGWTEGQPARLETLAQRFAAAGAKHLLCTDIDRDGTLGGINRVLYQQLCRANPDLLVQASGGVRELEDIRAAQQSGAAGIVLGRALLDGRFCLQEAIALLETPDDAPARADASLSAC